jgi:hypothetical protein
MNSLQLTYFPFQNSALDNLLRHLRSTFQNGGAEFARFQVVDCSLSAWFASRTRQDEQQLILDFLSNPTLSAACPSLNIQTPLPVLPEIAQGSAFTFDGELAQTLWNGGAYQHFSGTGADTKLIGQQFCAELYADRYADIQIYKTQTAWSEWFSGVAWDCTWIGLDLTENQIWMLCVTDTD